MTRLWRWLCCRTGHHRETVRSGMVFTTKQYPDSYCITMREGLEWYCPDCQRTRLLSTNVVSTPSRRYALRGKA